MEEEKISLRGWDAKVRIFLLTIGREMHQDEIASELQRMAEAPGVKIIDPVSVFRHLQDLEKLGLVKWREVEPEHGIKKKKVYRADFRGLLKGLKAGQAKILTGFLNRYKGYYHEAAIKLKAGFGAGTPFFLGNALWIPYVALLTAAGMRSGLLKDKMLIKAVHDPDARMRFIQSLPQKQKNTVIGTITAIIMPLVPPTLEHEVGSIFDFSKSYADKLTDEDVDYLLKNKQIYEVFRLFLQLVFKNMKGGEKS
jgi:hypothetical protein